MLGIMEQILMEEQLSFDHKLTHIQNTNNVLDELQRKMNSFFNKATNAPLKPIHTDSDQINEVQKQSQFNDDNRRRKSLHDQYAHQQVSQPGEEDSFSKKERLQFKLYHQKQEDNQQDRESDIHYPPISRPPTTYDNQTNHNTQTNGRESKSGKNSRSRKSNDEFRLFGKSKEAYLERESLEKRNQSREKQREREREREKQREGERENVKPVQSLSIRKLMEDETRKSNRGLLHSMETIQIVMKQAMDGKLRKIKQIQQQIMTQNEERVYLYKLNVRLNDELKHIKQEQISKDQEKARDLEWTVRSLQDDIDKAKRELERKKAERKQLAKEEHTLRDGYETLVNNKKNMLRRDIENYRDGENRSKENTEMLMGLMKELDKLKGVVESKIKTSAIKNSGVSAQKSRKVIKSFKN